MKKIKIILNNGSIQDILDIPDGIQVDVIEMDQHCVDFDSNSIKKYNSKRDIMLAEDRRISQAVEYADAQVAEDLGAARWIETDEVEHYTDKAQDLFNKYYDSYQRLII
mgnify:CR=1 FL=1